MGDGGKGSAQRPIANRKTFEENWDAIFGAGNNNGNVPDSVFRRGADWNTKGQSTNDERNPEDKPPK